MDVNQDTGDIPIALRAYVPRKLSPQFPEQVGASEEWALVFDTETTNDAAQSLRIGVYHLYCGAQPIQKGIFYDEENLSANDLTVIQHYASHHPDLYDCISKSTFIEDIFYGMAYKLGALIVGFNLPFDLSRLAFHHAEAKKGMRGGFSFQLSHNPYWPRLQIKHLSRRASIIRFAQPKGQKTARSMRQREEKLYSSPGFFQDVKTLAAALTGKSFSLETLANILETDHRKQSAEEHGGPITHKYLEYAITDVEVTWECFIKLRDRYDTHKLTKTRHYETYSEAGLGKAYLQEMNIQPWRRLRPEMSARLIGIILSTFYGGRAEVRMRRQIAPTLYCDFLSMYPTVCTLMGLWRWVIAQGVEPTPYKQQAQDFLDAIDLAQLQDPATWKKLCVLVKVKPQGDIFPVRGKYRYRDTKEKDSSIVSQYTTGLNRLSSEEPVWFTMADCIASKLLTGKAPQVLSALYFEAKEPQSGLSSVNIAGNTRFHVDPHKDDFFKLLIELRTEIKKEIDDCKDETMNKLLQVDESALKILANATSYGIFVEMNMDELSRKKRITCYGYEGKGFSTKTWYDEKPGKYFHPLIATCITGAARLMLSLAETLAAKHGLGWILCDTDSMAFTKPKAMPEKEFQEKVQSIQSWFDRLNPYATKDHVLKIEKANFALDKQGRTTSAYEPLYCLAVSAKRYVLFNNDHQGNPIIRKGSAHGLGHLRPPYERTEDREGIASPLYPPEQLLDKIGVTLWQHDVWYKIILAMRASPDSGFVKLLGGQFDEPSVSPYAATNPILLSWFSRYNAAPKRRDNYNAQVKPFNFLYALHAKRFDINNVPPDDEEAATNSLSHYPRPVAPFDKDPKKAAKQCFDRVTGQPIRSAQLQSYKEVLSRYHLHPEAKFLNGNYKDTGLTHRRHVIVKAEQIHHIGKESNKLEEREIEDDPQALNDYGISRNATHRLHKRLSRARLHYTDKKIADTAGISVRYLRDIAAGKRNPMSPVWDDISEAITRLDKANPIAHIDRKMLFEQAQAMRKLMGSRAFGTMVGYDHAVIGQVLNGTRKPGTALLLRLQQVVFSKDGDESPDIKAVAQNR